MNEFQKMLKSAEKIERKGNVKRPRQRKHMKTWPNDFVKQGKSGNSLEFLLEMKEHEIGANMDEYDAGKDW